MQYVAPVTYKGGERVQKQDAGQALHGIRAALGTVYTWAVDTTVSGAMRAKSIGGRERFPVPTWAIPARYEGKIEVDWPTAYQWAPAKRWFETLEPAIARVARLRRSPIEQPFPGVAVIGVRLAGRSHRVGIDYSDYATVNEDCLRTVSLYFKMQFAEDGYPWDTVVPGGFVPGGRELYNYLPALRRIRDRQRFRFNVYGRFRISRGPALRRRAVELLCAQTRFQYEGSPAIIRYGRYLREAARSRVCIDLPGNGDLCFRLVDYLAIGVCVVGPRPTVRLHVDPVDGIHVAYARRDLSDLTDICERYLADHEARERMALAARLFFDKYLEQSQLAGYYVSQIVEALG